MGVAMIVIVVMRVVMPFMIMGLARLIFGTPIGRTQMLASLVGFGGALLVIQPSLSAYGLVALFPLGCALAFSFYEFATQAMSTRVDPVSMQLYTSVAGIAIAAPVLWAFDGSGVTWVPQRSFVEVQMARRWRQGLPAEVRLDVTAGAHVGENWMLMAQGFGGAVDGDGARWLSVEVTAVRDFGDWSVQGGWRQAVAGRDTPVAGGPIIGLWRRF